MFAMFCSSPFHPVEALQLLLVFILGPVGILYRNRIAQAYCKLMCLFGKGQEPHAEKHECCNHDHSDHVAEEMRPL